MCFALVSVLQMLQSFRCYGILDTVKLYILRRFFATEDFSSVFGLKMHIMCRLHSFPWGNRTSRLLQRGRNLRTTGNSLRVLIDFNNLCPFAGAALESNPVCSAEILSLTECFSSIYYGCDKHQVTQEPRLLKLLWLHGLISAASGARI